MMMGTPFWMTTETQFWSNYEQTHQMGRTATDPDLHTRSDCGAGLENLAIPESTRAIRHRVLRPVRRRCHLQRECVSVAIQDDAGTGYGDLREQPHRKHVWRIERTA